MPPLRAGRASKACESCRKGKTRCYASNDEGNDCLRCQTLGQVCSLKEDHRAPHPTSGSSSPHSRRRTGNRVGKTSSSSGDAAADSSQTTRVNERLLMLEQTVQGLVDRLDSAVDYIPISSRGRVSPPVQFQEEMVPLVAQSDPAPVLLIRDAAVDAGVDSPASFENQSTSDPDVISAGYIALPTVHTLLQLFKIHYARWVRFPEDISPEALLTYVRKSPLLLSSVLLIAVRHTTKDLADLLALKLFEDAKRRLQAALLLTPQPIHFFQAVLILSLWSTTVGQVPLSVDSWLLTGYALQQAMSHPDFKGLSPSISQRPAPRLKLDTWCIWNHLCVAHLQYCVGTKRKTLLTAADVRTCVALGGLTKLDNFESRMAAEVKLYWIIYQTSSKSATEIGETKRLLAEWRHEFSTLFDQPRSQFLQMGYHFGHLLSFYQLLRATREVKEGMILKETIEYCENIITLAIGTADERTPHLTDHIYHIVAFSALTLCRLIHTYEKQLLALGHEISEHDALVFRLINWLGSIGLPCHAAHLLGRIVLSQFRAIRPNFKPPQVSEPQFASIQQVESGTLDFEAISAEAASLYPDIIGSELFGMDSGFPWPEWNHEPL